MSGAPAASRVALVTGASGAIGSALAVGLAGDGLAVALLGRDTDRLEAARALVADTGAPAAVVPADVADPQAVSAAVSDAEARLGPVDLLVHAAARIDSTEVPVWEADAREWADVVTTDLLGTHALLRAVLPGMVQRRAGRVVTLGTGIAVLDAPVYSAYAAAKAAVLRLVGHVAVAGRDAGVTAFDVAPGVVRSPMTEAMAMHDWRGPGDWTPVERVVDLVRAVAAGRLDALSGRHLRADVDDAETLLAAADRIVELDARTLRLTTWGPDDPLA